MRRISVFLISLTLLAAACGNGESAEGTSTIPPSVTSTSLALPTSASPATTAAPTTTAPPTTTNPTTTTTLPEPPDVPAMEALAWGLFCRDLRAAGYGYVGALAYWYAEGRPARMDADENGIPCETVYPPDDVVAFWGEPLPTGLSPGPGSGWRSSNREASVVAGCCSMNNNGPVSPPLPPATGAFPNDGAYSVAVVRDRGQTDRLELTVRRWLPCSEEPDQCSPDLYPGDVYPDPDDSVVRRLDLDENVIVVVRPIPVSQDDEWAEAPIEGDGAALASLLRRVDAAIETFAEPAHESGSDGYGLESDFYELGGTDPTFPYGPAPTGDSFGTILSYRGPAGAYLTPGFYAVFDYEEPDWMYGWWCTLEVVAGTPVLYVWAGQIAG